VYRSIWRVQVNQRATSQNGVSEIVLKKNATVEMANVKCRSHNQCLYKAERLKFLLHACDMYYASLLL